MRSKRLLSLLLVICLLVSVVAPSVTAVTADTASIITDKKANTQDASSKQNSLLVSGEKSNTISTLRDKEASAKPEANTASTQKGSWTAAPSDVVPSVDMPTAQLPSHIAALREAAEIYADDEVVSAFVVMEDEPLIQFYSSMRDVPVDEEELLEQQQEAVIMLIEEDVLDGEELDVTDQFTYITNSIVINTAFGNLETIAQLPGVKSVFLTPVYQACTVEDAASPYTVSSGAMSNVYDVWNGADLGYTGSGMTIAILDTGLDLDHPSFAAAPALGETSWDLDYVESVLGDLNAYAMNSSLTAEDVYYSDKIPFIFNYDLGSTDVGHNDYAGDHGTHVTGIAAANDVEGSNVVGMAPDAQIVVMKVFNAGGGAYLNPILSALEDAMALGCDVANLSLGSPAGFSTTIPEIDDIWNRISESDIIVNVAAGNEGTSSYGNMWGTNKNPTEHIDNSTISSPATYANAMAVASIENKIVAGSYFTLADGTDVFYMDSIEYLYGETGACLANLAGETLEYVIVPGLGSEEDFAQVDVAGKVAVIKRGELSFAEKAMNAEAAGAVAAIIWNNNSDYIYNFGMTTTDEDGNMPYIPVALITLADGDTMEAAETKTMAPSEETGFRSDIYGGQVSSFSSWGASPDLRLVPDLAGVGGNVYSCYDGGKYGLMSGTSMASPQVAGVTALVLQYLREQFPDASESEMRVLADSLLMSTAVPTISMDSNLEASPRQQGAGLVNALYAVTSEAYLTVNGSDRPKAELFDNESGNFSFTFVVHNFGTEEKTYALSSSLLSEAFVTVDGKDFMAGYDCTLSGTVSFSEDTVTVAPGGSVSVDVTIALSEEDKAWMAEHFVNGNYVEGYIYLTAEEGVNLSLPFMGFYGDWTDAPVFDTAYWYGNNFWSVKEDEVEGSEWFHTIWTDLQGTSWVLGFNPYTGAVEDENGDIVYDPANNVISNNDDGLVDYFDDIYLSTMRNAREVTFTYTDENGSEVYSETSEFVTKTMYYSSIGQIYPYLHSEYWYPYDFTDADGNPLPHGTKLTLTISAVLDYEGAEAHYLKEIPITLDVEAPVLVGDPVESSADGKNYVTITVSDLSLAYVGVMNPTGTRYLADYADADFVKNDDGTYTVQLDVTGFGNEMLLAMGDYGCNEAYYDLTYSTENKPEVDTSALYGYRIYDEEIGVEYGYDYMFGWVTIGKEDASIDEQTSDYLEYYALTAAEYAGGYVFAVDAGGNFIVMEPGLWNRKTICNLDVSAVDMTFDETTSTMYLAAKAEDYWGDEVGCLYSIDLTTGALELLHTYDSTYDMPYAMTAAAGTIYAIKCAESGFYAMDAETYELAAVTDAEGNDLVMNNANGSSVYPYYAQSMTYSDADGKIYWAYVSYMGLPELFVIDPADMSYTSIPFATDSEYIGLLVLEDDGYTLPEAEAIESLVLSGESLLLVEGETAQLTVSPLPWNAPMGELTWSSADESVATVDADGVVTAVSEGYTEITVSCDGVEAYCTVNVVKIEGTLYAYDYYDWADNYGNWISVDLETMAMENLYASPVDFIAADYNGHDGMIYGYDENFQAYRFDPATGECTALGVPVSDMIMDMAYDYSTGYMYAISIDYNTYTSTLHYVNMNTGSLTDVATAYDFYLTLACDTDGGLYAVSSEGVLYMLYLYENSWGGGGIMPWSTRSASANMAIEPIYIMEGFEPLNAQQSMCFDHNTRKLVWAQADVTEIYWIDPFAAEPYAVPLGDPTESGLFQFIGLYTVPEEIPELPYIPVESVSAEDMLLMVGTEKLPAVSVEPLNATNQSVTWTSADASIATVSDSGTIVAVSEGTTTISGTLVDGENSYDLSFNVIVKPTAGNIYGFVLTDIASYGGLIWAQIDDVDPSYPFYLAGTMYTIYSEEYVDGMIYAYGFDGEDWEANWQFMTIDPETFEIVDMQDLGEGFPFVYDITYDYTTGTMYALAGPDEISTDLYMVNMATGALIPVMQTEPFFMSIAAAPDGTLYAMEASAEEFDPVTWETTYTNAKLYTIDVANGTYELAFDTGVKSNMLASMTFDYTTGSLYWSALYGGGSYTGGLHLIDLETKKAYNLGAIGSAGSQVSGLFTISDPEVYPEGPDSLQNVSLMSTKESLFVGETVELETFIQPAGIEAETTWESADESVATVDENGVVTAVAPGVTVVTVTVTDGENTFTASCVIIVFGEDDYLLSYNTTDHGWAQISRQDSTVVTAANTDDEDVLAVRSAAMVDGVIYGYDVENGFFSTTEESGFVRTYLGQGNYETFEDTETEDFFYEVRDMAWDGERMLAIVCESALVTSTDWYGDPYTYTAELDAGCSIYEVNLENGELTYLCTPITMDGYEMSNVYSIAVDAAGVVYIYTSFDDYICALDVETGETTRLNSLSRLSIYGGSDGEPMALVYDPITCDLYLLMTQNGNYYRLFRMDTKTYALSEVGHVGETAYDPSRWATFGDDFAALVVNAEHIHVWTEWVVTTEPTEDTAGEQEHECLLCGEGETEEIPATGTTTEPTEPEETQPEETQPEETQPEETQPEETQPEETQPEETQPEETQPEETQPEETQPEETQPEETQPEETQPEETQPEETQPEETQPEETQPEETQPEETQPEETQPEETQPEEIQPEETQPEETQKPTKPGIGDNVQTGDNFMGGLWTTMLILSMAGVAVLLTFRKKWMA